MFACTAPTVMKVVVVAAVAMETRLASTNFNGTAHTVNAIFAVVKLAHTHACLLDRKKQITNNKQRNTNERTDEEKKRLLLKLVI